MRDSNASRSIDGDPVNRAFCSSPISFGSNRSHIATFGESAIRIETVYYVLDPDYKKYMDIQQAINIAVLERFGKERVKFAFPSRTVYSTALTASS